MFEPQMNADNQDPALFSRHPRESGRPGQATSLATLDARFRGHDNQESIL
jgi:hypothetical protein